MPLEAYDHTLGMGNNDKRQFIFTLADDDVYFFMYVAGSAQENINECDSTYFSFEIRRTCGCFIYIIDSLNSS